MLLPVHTRLANLLGLTEKQIINTIALLDDGATVPFIARYRKEVTGGVSDEELRNLVEKLTYMRELDARRETILNSIREQDKLTPELEQQILAADNKTTLEDLYLPYKPKRRTKAQLAREAGLEPLALIILHNQNYDLELEANKYINPEKNISDYNAALDGARHILIEIFAEDAATLADIRSKLSNEGLLIAKVLKNKEVDGVKFTDYFNYAENIKTIPSHRALAVLRGANEGVLSIKIGYPGEEDVPRGSNNPYDDIIIRHFKLDSHAKCGTWLIDTARLCFKSKILTMLETEFINTIRDKADEDAIKVFATNLNHLLLQSPAGNKTTIGLDPGIRTGVKVAVVDNTGKVLETTIIYPFQPQNRYTESVITLENLVKKYKAELISIGNGTASRETEKLVHDMTKLNPDLKVLPVIVSEAGASVYSASALASKEFPDMDVSLRGAVSIARRLQDPLAELVKIDPKSIGVGQYQHDVNQTKLSQSLTNVVEDCVNKVGVDLNTASVPLLTNVSGLNSTIASNIVAYRDKHGKFYNREELKLVARLGEKTFEQCAGFLRIQGGDNILDSSSVHPESYPLVTQIADKLNLDTNKLIGSTELLKQIKPTDFVNDIHGLPTILDVLKELEKPGRDPRGEFKTAKFKEGVDTIDDLSSGMELEGVVTNVTNFGAFIDIGVHQDGLVHVSEISDKYITNPAEVLKAGQIIKVRVMQIDKPRKRITLTMKGLNPSLNIPVIRRTNQNANSSAVSGRQRQPIAPEGALASAFANLKLRK